MSNEKPILFKDDMIRAILEGRKCQTRRVVKMNHACSRPEHVKDEWWHAHETGDIKCPYGKLSDRLWVREAHAFVPMPAYRCSTGIYQKINPSDDYEACVYRENFDRACSFPWRPSIHMPRWASRITLEITDVRVERLQDISEDGAKAEGAEIFDTMDLSFQEIGLLDVPEDDIDQPYRNGFAMLWESINGPGSWDENPWVWCISFKRIDA